VKPPQQIRRFFKSGELAPPPSEDMSGLSSNADADDTDLDLSPAQKISLAAELGWELHKYARLQQRDELKRLLESGGAYCRAPEVGPDVNWRDENGSSALWWTCLHGDSELAQLLLDAGADPNGTDKDDWTAVSIAARNGHDNCIAVLVKAGAELSLPVSDGDTALDKAIFWEQEDSERLLREHGGARRVPQHCFPRASASRRTAAPSPHRVPAAPPCTHSYRAQARGRAGATEGGGAVVMMRDPPARAWSASRVTSRNTRRRAATDASKGVELLLLCIIVCIMGLVRAMCVSSWYGVFVWRCVRGELLYIYMCAGVAEQQSCTTYEERGGE